MSTFNFEWEGSPLWVLLAKLEQKKFIAFLAGKSVRPVHLFFGRNIILTGYNG